MIFVYNNTFFFLFFSFVLQNPIKLSDINTLSELECLSVKQLKNLLSINRVDYKGCVERYELLNKASRLWEEYKQSKTSKIQFLFIKCLTF